MAPWHTTGTFAFTIEQTKKTTRLSDVAPTYTRRLSEDFRCSLCNECWMQTSYPSFTWTEIGTLCSWCPLVGVVVGAAAAHVPLLAAQPAAPRPPSTAAGPARPSPAAPPSAARVGAAPFCSWNNITKIGIIRLLTSA